MLYKYDGTIIVWIFENEHPGYKLLLVLWGSTYWFIMIYYSNILRWMFFPDDESISLMMDCYNVKQNACYTHLICRKQATIFHNHIYIMKIVVDHRHTSVILAFAATNLFETLASATLLVRHYRRAFPTRCSSDDPLNSMGRSVTIEMCRVARTSV